MKTSRRWKLNIAYRPNSAIAPTPNPIQKPRLAARRSGAACGAVLAARNIALDELTAALRAANANTPVGTIEGRQQTLTLHATRQLRNAAEFAHLLVSNKGGSTVRLRDVARVEDSYETVKTQANFNGETSITLAIQRETGGNLAETLSNLADVLRKRAQMKLKIKAMSSESKASAYIVGSLPFVVFTLLWWVNPDYIGQFFEDDRLIMAGLGGLVWMGIGVGIMAKMVSFEI